MNERIKNDSNHFSLSSELCQVSVLFDPRRRSSFQKIRKKVKGKGTEEKEREKKSKKGRKEKREKEANKSLIKCS